MNQFTKTTGQKANAKNTRTMMVSESLDCKQMRSTSIVTSHHSERPKKAVKFRYCAVPMRFGDGDDTDFNSVGGRCIIVQNTKHRRKKLNKTR